MPIGLGNAPETFQGALEIIVRGLHWQSCQVYLDDAIVFSPSATQQVNDIDEILPLLKKAAVTLKLKTCSLFKRKVD